MEFFSNFQDHDCFSAYPAWLTALEETEVSHKERFYALFSVLFECLHRIHHHVTFGHKYICGSFMFKAMSMSGKERQREKGLNASRRREKNVYFRCGKETILLFPFISLYILPALMSLTSKLTCTKLWRFFSFNSETKVGFFFPVVRNSFSSSRHSVAETS